MLEATIQLGQPPVSIYAIDPNTALPEPLSGQNSRQTVHGAEASKLGADPARQNDERERIAQLLDVLQNVASQLTEQRHALLQEMQQVAIELATAVATQAIYTKIQAGDFPIESLGGIL